MSDEKPYPGNSSLPKEVREKILSTFRHTLNLYRESKSEECAIGCDFILKMDPRFAPARQLLEKIRNPASPLDLAALEAVVAETSVREERPATSSPEKLLITAIEKYNARDFDGAIGAASRALAALPDNADAREIIEKSQRKKEAVPFIENFRQRALFALDSGQLREAQANFEKMKALDPDYPEVATLAQLIEAARKRLEPTPPPAEEAMAGLSLEERRDTGPVGLPRITSQEPEVRFDLAAPGQAETAAVGSDFDLGLDAAESPSPSAPPLDFWQSDEGEAPASLVPPSTPPTLAATPPVPSGPAAASPEIARLLREGDEAEGRGDRQAAIEIWSRIFLHDINNAEATARIEQARAALASSHRRVTESLKTGRTLFEAGQFKAAREKFLDVLAVDSSDPTARSFLSRIEDELSRPPTPSLDLSSSVPTGDVLSDELASSQAPAAPPTAEEPFEFETPVAPSPARRRSPLPLVAAGALVLLFATGATFIFLRGRSKPAPAPGAQARNAVEEARHLFAEGKVEEALAALRAIPKEDPEYARAQKLLDSYKESSAPPALPARTASPTAVAPAPGPDAPTRRAVAEKALAEHRYIEALASFNLAASAYANDEEFQKGRNLASEKVQLLEPSVKLYNGGDYDTAVPMLWRIYQADRTNQDARAYLIRCYFNLGLNALHAGVYDKAAQSFGEALQLEPQDQEAARHKKFAERYQKATPDLLARIYVKYLKPRP